MELCRTEEFFVQKRVFLQNHDIMTGSIALGDAYAEVTESADLLGQYMKRYIRLSGCEEWIIKELAA